MWPSNQQEEKTGGGGSFFFFFFYLHVYHLGQDEGDASVWPRDWRITQEDVVVARRDWYESFDIKLG